jgi:hypothetical protein
MILGGRFFMAHQLNRAVVLLEAANVNLAMRILPPHVIDILTAIQILAVIPI